MKTIRIALALAFLAVSFPALAQVTPDPAPDRGGILATYSLAHPTPDQGRISLEADLRVGGTPLLLVGYVSEDGAGVGPQVKHNLGPVTIFGHTLIGQFETGPDADRDSGLRHGGGVEIPIRDGLVFRIGFDSTTAAGADPVTASSFGVGWRW